MMILLSPLLLLLLLLLTLNWWAEAVNACQGSDKGCCEQQQQTCELPTRVNRGRPPLHQAGTVRTVVTMAAPRHTRCRSFCISVSMVASRYNVSGNHGVAWASRGGRSAGPRMRVYAASRVAAVARFSSNRPPSHTSTRRASTLPCVTSCRVERLQGWLASSK